MQHYNYSDLSRPLCTASLGSMTSAIKARRLLSSRGIEVKVKKVGQKDARQGCVYGLDFPCEIFGNLRRILNDGGIFI